MFQHNHELYVEDGGWRSVESDPLRDKESVPLPKRSVFRTAPQAGAIPQQLRQQEHLI